jgi:hypothetical protein
VGDGCVGTVGLADEALAGVLALVRAGGGLVEDVGAPGVAPRPLACLLFDSPIILEVCWSRMLGQVIPPGTCESQVNVNSVEAGSVSSFCCRCNRLRF